MKALSLRAAVFALCMAAALAGAAVLRPTQHLARMRPPIDLQAQVPTQFGEWREVKTMTPLQPNPEMQSRLDALYTQVLARTYVNAKGEHVMLSIAYGSDQNSEATAVHRPEFCYSAQGFKVTGAGKAELDLGTVTVPIQRLVTQQGSRLEPVTYWVTLDTKATLPGVGRKLAQLQYGLKGYIADGMLVRVSTIGTPSLEKQFAVQDAFLRDMHRALPTEASQRYFGAPAATSSIASR